jgi:hypothetical protein
MMGFKVTVAYYSTSRGVTQQTTGVSAIHYGKVFKIPQALFSEDGEVDFEKDIGELVEKLQGKGLEPISDEPTVERYETLDMETGDTWVMYRVPCKGKDR